MAVQTFSSRDFTRDVARAKRATDHGTVFITDRGKPSYALLSMADYNRLTGHTAGTLLALMDSIECASEIEFDPPRWSLQAVPAAMD